MADTGELLEAGAVLPAGTHTGEDADVLTARTYRHPALGGRAVVRLVGETLGEAEDLALDFLSLARESVTAGLGQVRRETLGFPAWALVNDPANGHHALALVKDIERLGRMAKSRAGAAKDGFDQLGERLGRSVPHFLPTYYEQAGRCFLQHENTTYAAAFFGKAREAERVHSLAVDEDRQRAVFLEFAFAGALTVKALKSHVQDLTRRLTPAAAWEQYRRLTVERCNAGLPPYAALPQDARRLIKAAGLDRVTEECALLAALLATPSIGRAPGSFWTAYRATLVVLAEREPAVRRRLLEIVPTGNSDAGRTEEGWLDILAETGAAALLTAPEPDPATDAGAWLHRWAMHLQSGWSGSRRSPATYALVRRMAPRLRAEGRPVDLFQRRYWRIGCDLDLADICLAEGIALAPPPAADQDGRFSLDDWWGGYDEGRQSLEAVGADPRFVPLLRQAVAHGGRYNSSGNRHVHRTAAHPVLRTVLADYLAERADALTGAAGLPGIGSALGEISFAREVAGEVSADAVARVRGHDVTRVLARTLRAGIMDELGWPALDEALGLLGPVDPNAKNNWQTVQEAWPALIVARRHKAVVVGPEGVLLEHDLRLPDTVNDYRQPDFRWAGGELLVRWWEDGKHRGYWSARPAEIFDMTGDPGYVFDRRGLLVSLPLPDGARSFGSRPLHAGDTALPKQHRVIADGQAYWRLRETTTADSWLEYEPATGAVGRASLPPFLAGAVRDGSSLRHADCQLLPLRPGMEGSPLGTDGTVLGHWVRQDGDLLTAGTPDGTTVTMAPDGDTVPVGALRLPGGAAVVLGTDRGRVSLHRDGAAAGEGALGHAMYGHRGETYAAGWEVVPPLSYWHALRPRDEAGSLALRDISDELAGELFGHIEAVAAAFHERPGDPAGHPRLAPIVHLLPPQALRPAEKGMDRGPDRRAAVDAVVARLLPAVTHPALRTGVGAVVGAAVQTRHRMAHFTDPVQPEAKARPADDDMFADHRPENGDDRTVLTACQNVLGVGLGGAWSDQSWSVLRQIRSVGRVFTGEPAAGKPLPAAGELGTLPGGWTSDPLTIPRGATDWPKVLDRLPLFAYCAARHALAADERTGLLLLLDELADSGLTERGGTLRRTVLREGDHRRERTGQVMRHGDRIVVLLAALRTNTQKKETDWLALDLDPSGTFGPVAHFTTLEDRLLGTCPADRLRTATRCIREHGPAPWRPEAVDALAGAPGSGPAQSALLIAGILGTGHTPPSVLADLTGLRSTHLDHGHDRLGALDVEGRSAVLGALLPEDPASLWTEGPDTTAAVAAWTRWFGGLVRLPEDLEISFNGIASPAAAEAVLNPDRTPWLSRTTTQWVDEEGRIRAGDSSAIPASYVFVSAVRSLALLAYELPGGHPLRAPLPGALDALRRRLRDPGLLLDFNLAWSATGGGTVATELRKVHGLPEAGGAGKDGLTPVGEAFVLAPLYREHETTLLRPAALTGPDDPALGLLEGLAGGSGTTPLDALRTVLGDGLERAVATAVPDGYAHDPGLSVPGLVAEAAKEHGLSDDAAVVYLQLLALPDPTDRNCARWTGWKPARLKKARAELAATDLVVGAKRSRAGRSLFLPGGWEALKAPALPLETWKRGHLPADDARVIPAVPVSDLFETAWQRVRDGDVPAFEELTTRATRKGRRR
ncbi:hypothetical protein [Streptomyces smaragdinus]|nr:hypothetical protein [Streptomyces smaragdinus]